MHKALKLYITIAVLSATIIYCFAFPKVKYRGPEIISQLEIPYKIKNWQGKDMEQQMNLEEEKYNFISQVFQREYVNMNGKNLFLHVLDAGNFHNPKVCCNGAGFKVKEIRDIEFHILNRSLRTHAIYAQKGEEGFFIIYWICINKNVVDWTEQKIKQLWFSALNKNRESLMIRLDIPGSENAMEDALRRAQEFVADLGRALTSENADFILGRQK